MKGGEWLTVRFRTITKRGKNNFFHLVEESNGGELSGGLGSTGERDFAIVLCHVGDNSSLDDLWTRGGIWLGDRSGVMGKRGNKDSAR